MKIHKNRIISLALAAILALTPAVSSLPAGGALYSYADALEAAVTAAPSMGTAASKATPSNLAKGAGQAANAVDGSLSSSAGVATATNLAHLSTASVATSTNMADAGMTVVVSKGIAGLSELLTFRTDEEIEAEVAALIKGASFESNSALAVVNELGLSGDALIEAMGVDEEDTERIGKIKEAESLISDGEVLFEDDDTHQKIVSVYKRNKSVNYLLTTLLSDPRVESADPDYKVQLSSTSAFAAKDQDAVSTVTGSNNEKYEIAVVLQISCIKNGC
ncbi:MAG: hypothetical protein Q4E57_08320, partial [Eubacteriales bacterium]|nr:hypothetical protein [Eubacteriales bacterium]